MSTYSSPFCYNLIVFKELPHVPPWNFGLNLDLSNFRTVPQRNEAQALQAMIAISPDRFWALMNSLLDDGYLPTENILVIKDEHDSSKLIVKEGNRRIAALKLIHGYLSKKNIGIPTDIEDKISDLADTWKKANESVPCTIYDFKDHAKVDKIVTLTHGKGEKAGREHWEAIARARHNRDVNGASEAGLDLLEKYLRKGKNLTESQKERWAGDFPLTVLDEAIKRIATRFGVANAPELAKKYPGIPHCEALEKIILNIGHKNIRFETIRSGEDFAGPYGVPLPPSPAAPRPNPSPSPGPSNPGAKPSPGPGGPQGNPNPGGPNPPGNPPGAKPKVTAVPIHDSKAVIRTLKKFKPKGRNREKIDALRIEATKLKIKVHPFAFCFLLRSMFEISAKVYCDDHKATGGPSLTKNGNERKLVEVLRDITNHLTQNKSDKEMVKVLHGAMTELARTKGILSVTSMNQLVHNRSFSISENDISLLFGNIFPLLESMNK